MLQTIDGFIAIKFRFAKSINELGNSKMIVKTSSMESKTGFLTLGAMLAFGKLGQAFSTAPILHHLELECHI